MLYILLKKVKDAEKDAILEGSFQDMEMENFFNSEGETITDLEDIDPISFNLDIYTVRGRMTDHLYIEGIKNPIFSKKAKDLIEKLNVWNVQFFPLHIVDEYSNLREVQLSEYKKDESVDYKTVNYDNYFICNLEGLVDCVDHEASELEYFSPLMSSLRGDVSESMKSILESKNSLDIDTIFSLKIDETRIPENIGIFRLLDCTRIILVNEEIVRAITEAELTGFVFIPISKYSEDPERKDKDEEIVLDFSEQPEVEKNKPVESQRVESRPKPRQISRPNRVTVKPDRPPSLMSDLEDDSPSEMSESEDEDDTLLADKDGRLKRSQSSKPKIVIKKINRKR